MMSLVKQDGNKDVVFMQTKEEENKPFNTETRELMDKILDEEDEDEPEGPLKANGEINWSCPCMANMVSGPCGYAFREAFSCFHYSKEESKGSDCVDKFRAMSECFREFPSLYPTGGPDEDEEGDIWGSDSSKEDPQLTQDGAKNEKAVEETDSQKKKQ